MGALRGIAHAGYEGDDKAVISASLLAPSQLRIAKEIMHFEIDKKNEHIMASAFLDEQKLFQLGRVQQLIQTHPQLAKNETKLLV
jgi:septum site-determining protein MinC